MRSWLEFRRVPFRSPTRYHCPAGGGSWAQSAAQPPPQLPLAPLDYLQPSTLPAQKQRQHRCPPTWTTAVWLSLLPCASGQPPKKPAFPFPDTPRTATRRAIATNPAPIRKACFRTATGG